MGGILALAAAAWAAGFGVAAAGAEPAAPGAAELLAAARASLAAGAGESAAAALRRLRVRYPESPLVADALLLSAAAAAARDDPYQERFFLREARRAVRGLAAGGVLSAAAANDYHLQAASRLAQLLAADRDYAGALRHYEEAIGLLAARLPAGARSQAQRLAALRLAAAELAYHHGAGIAGDAERHFEQIAVGELTAAALPAYRELARGLMWRHLTPGQLGMGDANVSAIATDGDDVWVGSWTGGLTRHTRSTGRRQVFREQPDALLSRRVRAIRPVEGYVWVGTDRGLSVYARSSSRWRHEVLDGGAPSPVAALAEVGGVVYAGTLGQGLWRRDASGWRAVGHGSLPGQFINALLVVGDTLWIGTIDLGLVSLDLQSGALRGFDEINEALGPQNVTALAAQNDATLWIGTFGAGLYRWEAGPNRVTHFSAATGQLPDDWILAAAVGDTGIYFGTFGGGGARYDPRRGAWTTISLAQGLPSLNVAVVAAARGHVYFGTLGAGVAILSEARSVHGLQ